MKAPITEELVNPYGIDISKEFPHTPDSQANWTEYHYFFGYDKDADVGVSLHIGRLVEDLRIWRGILFILLPGDQVLVRKYAGRGEGARGFNAGPLSVTCVEPMRLKVAGTDYSRPESAQQTKTAALVRCGEEVGIGQLDRYVRIKTLSA